MNKGRSIESTNKQKISLEQVVDPTVLAEIQHWMVVLKNSPQIDISAEKERTENTSRFGREIGGSTNRDILASILTGMSNALEELNVLAKKNNLEIQSKISVINDDFISMRNEFDNIPYESSISDEEVNNFIKRMKALSDELEMVIYGSK